MKNRIPNYFIFPIIIVIIICIVPNCKKDTECEVVVTVKRLSDTNVKVPNARVKVGKYDVVDSGISDGAGQYTAKFKSEAIMDVIAVYDSTTPPLTGETSVRLKPGKTVYKSVFIN